MTDNSKSETSGISSAIRQRVAAISDYLGAQGKPAPQDAAAGASGTSQDSPQEADRADDARGASSETWSPQDTASETGADVLGDASSVAGGGVSQEDAFGTGGVSSNGCPQESDILGKFDKLAEEYKKAHQEISDGAEQEAGGTDGAEMLEKPMSIPPLDDAQSDLKFEPDQEFGVDDSELEGRLAMRAQNRRSRRRGKKPDAKGEGATETNTGEAEDEDTEPFEKKERKGRGKRKKQHIGIRILKWFLAAILILVLAALSYGLIYVYGIVKDLPKHDPTQIQNSLKSMSTIYDDQGVALKDIYLDDGLREIVEYSQLPENLVNAFIAIEDKTFWKHKGFNITRILGALRESVVEGGGISGTSTISQQLARNIWLYDERTAYDLGRKIKEAYYARMLEQNLTKQEIMTAYLNTIALGNHSYGIGAAAKMYFSKDISDLDLLESAALASLPAEPTKYSMVTTVGIGEVAPDDPRVLLATDQYIFVYNDTAESRIQLVLDEMLMQGLITQTEHDAAAADDIRAHLRPQALETDSEAAFFVDFLIPNVAEDLMEAYPENYQDMDQALQALYTGGLQIYSTYSQRIQSIVSEEFENPENYPSARLSQGTNAVGEDGTVLAYAYENMFQDEEDGPWFRLNEGEYEMREDGSMFIARGHRLGIYNTTSAAGQEINVEFREFFTFEEKVMYFTRGGIISIPSQYKSMDAEGNLILSADFFASEDNVFTVAEDGSWWIGPTHFSLRQAVVQPQGATTVIEHGTGQIKAMFGGRSIKGQMQYNRALNPRQPGSTMKPLGVYGPAIEMSANHIPVQSESEETSFGEYWTPLSIIIDEEFEYNEKVWPKNWYNGYRYAQTMRQAIEQSENVPAVIAQLAVGNQNSVTFLKKLGITTLVEEGVSNDLNPAALALGGMTQGLKPIESASAYGTFANAGIHVEPIAYTVVKDRDGNTILEGNPERTQAMDPGTAYIVNDMLRTAVSSGIASAAGVRGVPVAGKTGTSSEYYDAWFVGNTPKYSAAVWIGIDVQIQMSQGSAAASALFSKMMTRICEGDEQGTFPERPANVVSGEVDGRADIFIEGTIPEHLDYGSEKVEICLDSGLRATPWCVNVEEQTFNRRHDPADPILVDHPELNENLAPEGYCPQHNQDTETYPPGSSYSGSGPGPGWYDSGTSGGNAGPRAPLQLGIGFLGGALGTVLGALLIRRCR